MVPAIEDGFPQREIAESSYLFQRAVEKKDRLVVGVNDFVVDDEPPIGTLYIDESASQTQVGKVEALRKRRRSEDVQRALDALQEAARSGANTMPPLIDAARAYATVGEMCDALREVWGEYTEIPII